MIRALVTAAAAVTVVVACAGCTSSGGAASSPPPTPASVTAPPVSTADTAPVATPVASTSTPASASATHTTPAPTSPAAPPPISTPAFTTTCTKITVRVIPGGAIRGAEIAALQYVNDSTKACSIGGFPTARLLRNGAAIGTVSEPVERPAKTITVQPGEVAESLLQDFSDCNAPLSDNVRVSVPVRAGAERHTVARPAKLRACLLRVNPLGPPA